MMRKRRSYSQEPATTQSKDTVRPASPLAMYRCPAHRVALRRPDYQPEIPASVKAIRYTTPSHMRWVNVEDRFFVLDGKEVKPSAKIASFDMVRTSSTAVGLHRGLNPSAQDSTLIVSKSGRVFAQGRSDWYVLTVVAPSPLLSCVLSHQLYRQWMYDCIPNMLRKLHKSGFKIVIFTNQGGIKNNPSKAEEIKGKVIGVSLMIKLARERDLTFLVLGLGARRSRTYTRTWAFPSRPSSLEAAITGASPRPTCGGSSAIIVLGYRPYLGSSSEDLGVIRPRSPWRGW